MKTSDDVIHFLKDTSKINNIIPLDIYVGDDFEKFTKGSKLTKYLKKGEERVYGCGDYNFDIAFENGYYYTPFSLHNSLFFEHKSETAMAKNAIFEAKT